MRSYACSMFAGMRKQDCKDLQRFQALR